MGGRMYSQGSLGHLRPIPSPPVGPVLLEPGKATHTHTHTCTHAASLLNKAGKLRLALPHRVLASLTHPPTHPPLTSPGDEIICSHARAPRSAALLLATLPPSTAQPPGASEGFARAHPGSEGVREQMRRASRRASREAGRLGFLGGSRAQSPHSGGEAAPQSCST